jgi:hypothetical protein
MKEGLKKMNKDFWIKVGIKIIETCISVKVLTIAALLIVSTKLLIMGLLTAAVWGTVNTTAISVVFAMREAFKVAKVKSGDDSTNLTA